MSTSSLPSNHPTIRAEKFAERYTARHPMPVGLVADHDSVYVRMKSGSAEKFMKAGRLSLELRFPGGSAHYNSEMRDAHQSVYGAGEDASPFVLGNALPENLASVQAILTGRPGGGSVADRGDRIIKHYATIIRNPRKGLNNIPSGWEDICRGFVMVHAELIKEKNLPSSIAAEELAEQWGELLEWLLDYRRAWTSYCSRAKLDVREFEQLTNVSLTVRM
jgi:hypothetical protein